MRRRAGALALAALSMISGACATETSSEPTITAVTTSIGSTPPPVSDPVPPSTSVPTPPLDGVNGSALEHDIGNAVVMVLSRPCDGLGYSQGTGFAIDERTIITNWHVVAEDSESADSAVDPHPWIMTYRRGWRRGTVIGYRSSPDIAVVRLDESEPSFDRSLEWAQTGPSAGQHLAVLGFPGIEGGEFNLVVGTAADVDETTHGVPSHRIDRALSGRTGPGNSGGPVIDASGDVVGIHTWGTFDRSHWYGQDVDVVRSAAESIIAEPSDPVIGCPADGPERMPISYTVRLGTFARASEAEARLDIVRDAGPQGVSITSVNSTTWVPFLLSDYPEVLMAGPFASRESAREAVRMYQAAIDEAGVKDTFSVGVMPTRVFDTEAFQETDRSCMPYSGSFVVVHGVTDDNPLKLRSKPTTNADVLAELRAGEELMLGDEDPVSANGLKWIKVATLSGGAQKCGWVAQRYTQSLING